MIYDASLDELLQKVWDGRRINSTEALRLYRLPLEELPAAFGVDSVTYLSVDGLKATLGRPACLACFDGDYPVAVQPDEMAAIVADRRPVKAAV